MAHQAPLPVGFPRRECWSGLPFPSPGGSCSPHVPSEAAVKITVFAFSPFSDLNQLTGNSLIKMGPHPINHSVDCNVSHRYWLPPHPLTHTPQNHPPHPSGSLSTVQPSSPGQPTPAVSFFSHESPRLVSSGKVLQEGLWLPFCTCPWPH